MAKVLRLGEVGPLARLGQLVRFEVTGVPHQAVSGQRLAVEEACGVVDRIRADFGWHGLVGAVVLDQQTLLGQHLERVRRRGPEHVGAAAGGGLAHEGDAGRGVLVEDFDAGAGVLRFEGLLVGFSQLFGKRSDDGDGLLSGTGWGGEQQQKQTGHPRSTAQG